MEALVHPTSNSATTLKVNNMIIIIVIIIERDPDDDCGGDYYPKSDHFDHDEANIDDYCGKDGDDDVDDFNLSYHPDDDWGEDYCP